MESTTTEMMKKKRATRTEGYRPSRKRQKSLKTALSEDPLLLQPDELTMIQYSESVLGTIGRSGDLGLHKDSIAKVTAAFFPEGFVNQLKLKSAKETTDRSALGFPRLSVSLLFCELAKVGLSSLDSKRIQGTLPMDPPPLISRSALASLMSDVSFDSSQPLVSITISFPSILLAHACHGYQYKTSDILAAERSQASRFRRLISTALAVLKTEHC